MGRVECDAKGDAVERVSTYLNYKGQAEEAFTFYASVFGTELLGPITRIGDMPGGPGVLEVTEDEKKLVMHMEVPILAGHILMATDVIESMGHQIRVGNNTTINLELQDRAETERLFGLLGEGSEEISPLADMPWGAYWGTCLDQFGIRWMFNCYESWPAV
jgi:PhnB protein